MSTEETLRVATCQFPVCGRPAANAGWVRRQMAEAAGRGADVVHFPEAALSGYGGCDVPSFAAKDYDWDTLRRETRGVMALSRELGLWTFVGSAHFLSPRLKPTNCLYVISPDGRVVDRYDKCMLTPPDKHHYTGGNRLLTLTIKGQVCGFQICYDGCYPELYNAYRHKGVGLMFHSFYNASNGEMSCLREMVPAQVRTRAADNTMWVIANNSCAPQQQWPSCIARPSGTLAGALERNRPGVLMHDFPDNDLHGWLHNGKLMKLPASETFHNAKPSRHRRFLDRTSPP